MEQMIEFYAKKRLKPNEGYRFIKKDYVYVPIIQTYLIVTKRDFFALPLLDEIVLRLVNEEVHDITELVDILGIGRKLLEITIADLSVKNLLYCAADRCALMPKGQTALKELRVIQRSKECLKNIYLDPINGKVLSEYQQLTFLDKVLGEDDKKMEVEFTSDDLKVFKQNMESVNKVFLEETNIYNDKTKVQQAELISIDKIEKTYSKFVKIPLYIYVSDSGYDIDIMSAERKTENLLEQYKSEIISQIRGHKILKKVFTRYPLKGNYRKKILQPNIRICNLSQKYYKMKDGKDKLKVEIENSILSDRKLLDNEFDILFEYLLANAENVNIRVNHLDEWCYGDEFFVKILSKIDTKKLNEIGYSSVQKLDYCVGYINKTKKIDKSKFRQISGSPYISVELNEEWEILSIPEDILIIDDQTHVYKQNFYLQRIVKKDSMKKEN